MVIFCDLSSCHCFSSIVPLLVFDCDEVFLDGSDDAFEVETIDVFDVVDKRK